MTASNHTLTGALIAVTVSQPWLAVPLAFVSHFAMDALPHFGIHEEDIFERNSTWQFRLILLVDFLVTVPLLIFLPVLLHDIVSLWLLAVCIFAAISPDLVWGVRFFKEIRTKKEDPKSWFSKLHLWLQWSQTPPGAVTEIVWFAGVLALVIIKS